MTEVWAVQREDSDGYTYSAVTTLAVFSERPAARSAAARLIRRIREQDRVRFARFTSPVHTLRSGRKDGGETHRITVEKLPFNPDEVHDD